MDTILEPLKVQSLKEACIQKLESLILSGELKIGEKLPSERKLADSLNISRPVLHEALVDLESKGLVSILPRRGVFVSDYRREGSCAIINSLLNYTSGDLDSKLIRSLIEMRLLIEAENARLAALHRTPQILSDLSTLLEAEQTSDRSDIDRLTELDFSFHQLIAIASGNRMYPLIINSFKQVYTKLTGAFFKNFHNQPAVEEVFDYHKALYTAIKDKDSQKAQTTMIDMLEHGARHLGYMDNS